MTNKEFLSFLRNLSLPKTRNEMLGEIYPMINRLLEEEKKVKKQ